MIALFNELLPLDRRLFGICLEKSKISHALFLVDVAALAGTYKFVDTIGSNMEEVLVDF